MSINWPTALVMAAFVAAYAVLSALGHEVPKEVVAVVATIGTVVVAGMKKLLDDEDKPPPEGPSVLEDAGPLPTVRPKGRPANDADLLAVYDGHPTWPPPPEAA